jgi:transposase, IS5 family
MDLFIPAIGLPRATMKIGLANLVYNFKRLVFLRRRAMA